MILSLALQAANLRKWAGSSLDPVACIVSGCMYTLQKSGDLVWLGTVHSEKNLALQRQKGFSSELVYPRACGLGRIDAVMLEYAPWVRDICNIENEKQMVAVHRRRRAAHHLSGMASAVLDCFASQLICERIPESLRS